MIKLPRPTQKSEVLRSNMSPTSGSVLARVTQGLSCMRASIILVWAGFCRPWIHFTLPNLGMKLRSLNGCARRMHEAASRNPSHELQSLTAGSVGLGPPVVPFYLLDYWRT